MENIETPYTAVYMLLRQNGKIAFVLRQNTGWMNGYYGLIAGRVEVGEPFHVAAAREAKEEAGVIIKPEDLQLALVAHRNESGMIWVDLLFEVSKWEGEAHNAEPETHAELAWLDPDDLPENVVPSVRYYIEQLQAGNNYCEYGWAS